MTDRPDPRPGQEEEFRFLADIAAELGLPERHVQVRRADQTVDGGVISSLIWGTSNPEIALVHGGAQNAHTWDACALAIGSSLIAVDLPGHGRSSWRPDHRYSISAMAAGVDAVIEGLAPGADTIVGVGLGASVSLRVASRRPTLRRLVLVDALPGGRPTGSQRRPQVAAQVADFTSQHRFADFESLVSRAQKYSPGRSAAGIRRGLLQNAHQAADGSWEWRWDPAHRDRTDYEPDALAAALDEYPGEILVVAGGGSDIVAPDAVAQLQARYRKVQSVTIPDAEHGVQGTHPMELAEVLQTFRDS